MYNDGENARDQIIDRCVNRIGLQRPEKGRQPWRQSHRCGWHSLWYMLWVFLCVKRAAN